MSNLSTPSNDFPFLLLFVDSLVQNPCCLNMRMHYLEVLCGVALV